MAATDARSGERRPRRACRRTRGLATTPVRPERSATGAALSLATRPCPAGPRPRTPADIGPATALAGSDTGAHLPSRHPRDDAGERARRPADAGRLFGSPRRRRRARTVAVRPEDERDARALVRPLDPEIDRRGDDPEPRVDRPVVRSVAGLPSKTVSRPEERLSAERRPELGRDMTGEEPAGPRDPALATRRRGRRGTVRAGDTARVAGGLDRAPTTTARRAQAPGAMWVPGLCPGRCGPTIARLQPCMKLCVVLATGCLGVCRPPYWPAAGGCGLLTSRSVPTAPPQLVADSASGSTHCPAHLTPPDDVMTY